eukprot:m.75193 g.75193  ORF g.75193 m.75193 type:complete len:418 (+) comp12489_c0_seq1:81-1334(+)
MMLKAAYVWLCICFVLSYGHGATPEYFGTYVKDAKEFWNYDESGQIKKCIDMQQKNGFNFPVGKQNFQTAGMEGVGHHLFMTVPRELVGLNVSDKHPLVGGQRSFPMGFAQRGKPGHAPFIPEYSEDMLQNEKFIFLVRDPMDAMISAMSRFWMKPTVDTLFFELQASIYGLRRLHMFMPQFPCDRTLIIGNEKFLENPMGYRGVLAQFFGVTETDQILNGWLGGIQAKTKREQSKTDVCDKVHNCKATVYRVKFCRDLSRTMRNSEGANVGLNKYTRFQFCNETMKVELCFDRIREVIYNITRELRPYFPELIPRRAMSGCDSEGVPTWESPNYGKGVFERSGVDFNDYMKNLQANYPSDPRKKRQPPPLKVWNSTLFTEIIDLGPKPAPKKKFERVKVHTHREHGTQRAQMATQT